MMSTADGSHISAITLDLCKEACRSDGNCKGLDWTLSVTASPRCWLHDADNFATNAVSSTYADQYRKEECVGMPLYHRLIVSTIPTHHHRFIVRFRYIPLRLLLLIFLGDIVKIKRHH